MIISQPVQQWLDSLTVRRKHYYKDETYEPDFMMKVGLPQFFNAKSYIAKHMLRRVLETKSRIVMLGAGGTASWFLPKLLKIYNDAFTKCPDATYPLEIVVIDGDHVSQSNIIRQNFIPEDIGQNKALTLAERYSDIYPNITVTAIPLFGTSNRYDLEVTKLPAILSPENFVDLDGFIQNTDIIVNLVDNELFKRKLDSILFQVKPILYFNSGINLYNGQCYVSYPGLTNNYTIDHQDFIEDNAEVVVESCADFDANGSTDNPEQMFNGNDLAASLLANLYQTVITDVSLHRKICFTTGSSISITRKLDSFASFNFFVSLKLVSYPSEIAEEFIEKNGRDVDTEEARNHYEVYDFCQVTLKILDILSANIVRL